VGKKYTLIKSLIELCLTIQGDQKVSVHLMITVKLSGAQRLFITLYIVYIYNSIQHNEDVSSERKKGITLISPVL